MAELDDWDLCAEDLDFLEKDAIRKISEKKTYSSSPLPPRNPNNNPNFDTGRFGNPEHFPLATSSVPHYGKVEVAASSGSHASRETDMNDAADLPKLTVRLYLHATGAIAAKFPYHTSLVDACHKIPRATWHGNERLWIFPISSLAVAEEAFNGVAAANVEVQKLDPLVHRALTAAAAVPDLTALYDRMPISIESKLLPFQREGVRFVLQHGGRALLADEMGLGKTIQAIAVLLSAGGGSNRGGFKIVFSNTKGSIQLDGAFNIISYDAVSKFQDLLLASGFKVVIADESHFMKNAQAKRTSACLPVLQKAQFAILLSGTPALSRPIELYKQLEALYPDVYKKVSDYGNRYCKGGIFGLYQGASNHEELHCLMKATVMIRRLKQEVVTELPVKRRQQVFLDLSEKDTKQIRALFHELEVVKGNVNACESREELESLKVTQRNLISKIYNDSAVAKIPAVLDYLSTVIEAGCKFLVFAHHQPMIVSIHEFLLKKKVGCIRIDGSTPSASRQALVDDFQEKDDIKAAVLSIKAAGVGLTLTAASTVIFAELSWTPGDIIQAEDRAHRIGQVSSVNVYFLLAYDTADDIMWDVIQNKLDNLGQVLDGEQNQLEVSNSQGKSPRKQSLIRSPGKQHLTNSSPGKQKTLDNFLKRCSSVTEPSHMAQKRKI